MTTTIRGRPLMIWGGAEEIEKKKFLAALLREKKNFGGHSPGKKSGGPSPGRRIYTGGVPRKKRIISKIPPPPISLLVVPLCLMHMHYAHA